MQLTGLARLGRDAELRYATDGTAVCNLSLAFNYGKKGTDGNRPTQWLEGVLWGRQAEALAEYLTKGKALVVTLDDPHVEEYQKRDGTTSSKLSGRITNLEFAGGTEQREARDPTQRVPAPSAPARQAAAPKQTATAGNLADMDDDIPF